MTFTLINAVFLAVAGAVMLLALARCRGRGTPGPSWRALGLATAVLFALTAVFDNVMIAAGLFDYGREQRLGILVGQAPVEDFAYPLGAVLLLPAVWLLLHPGAPSTQGSPGSPGRRHGAAR